MLLRYLIILLFAFPAATLSAQFNLGIEGGLLASTVHLQNLPDDAHIDADARLHYFAGLHPTYDFAGKWSVGLDVHYAVRGEQFNAESTSEVHEYRRSCLDLTPHISWQALKWLDVNFGVYHSFLGHTELRFFETDDWLSPLYQYYDETDFGLAPGFRLKHGHFYLLLSGQIGLKTIAGFGYSDSSGEYKSDVKEKNRSLQLGIGYNIR